MRANRPSRLEQVLQSAKPNLVQHPVVGSLPNGEAVPNRVEQRGLTLSGKDIARITPAIIRDLAAAKNPEETLVLVSSQMKTFLAAFQTDSGPYSPAKQNPKGALELEGLVRELESAARRMDDAHGGAFAVMLRLSIQDGRFTGAEAGALQKAAAALLAKAENPAQTALQMRGILVSLDSALQSGGKGSALLGTPATDGPGAFDGAASGQLASLGRTLGKKVVGGKRALSLDKAVEAFRARIVSMGEGRGGLKFLPLAIDAEMSQFEGRGLSGTTRVRMEALAARHARALLETLNTPGLGESVRHPAYQLLAGKFMPPDLLPAFLAELRNTGDADAFKEMLAGLKEQADAVPQAGATFTQRQQRAALLDGVAIVQTELDRLP